MKKLAKICIRHFQGWIEKIRLSISSVTQDKDVLFAVWDFKVCPTTFDFANFLCHCEDERRIRKLESFQVIFIPGLVNGFRNENTYSSSNREWRFKNIIQPLIYLQSNCSGMLRFTSRDSAYKFLKQVKSSNIVPDHYKVAAPISFYGWDESFKRIAAGHNLQTLRSREEPRKIVREWINGHIGQKKFITITLRESEYEKDRNSDLEVWTEFVSELDKSDIIPVIIRDQEKAILDSRKWTDVGALVFDAASWDVEIRHAVYEYANLNFFVNNGPFVLALFSENIKYAVFRMITESVVVASRERLLSLGWSIGQNFPQAGRWQNLFWENETPNELNRVCVEYLDGQNQLLRDYIDLGLVEKQLDKLLPNVPQTDLESTFEKYKLYAGKYQINPNVDFDEAYYRERYPTVDKDVEDCVYNSGYEHYLVVGKYKNYRAKKAAHNTLD